ncbi:hypothetical protein K490DRAFT_57051 [Saccharata proteae CBS 121410]|uniref:Uncharacterized protein n=1 Tax=Saccharata proteae CBS 121410 TaxID=1314787 RepID=A0A9P4HVZ8_9PEZI|nr:hypothetical protein K490DRAFT_57051 [Saccharata proteae CBS 121410]
MSDSGTRSLAVGLSAGSKREGRKKGSEAGKVKEEDAGEGEGEEEQKSEKRKKSPGGGGGGGLAGHCQRCTVFYFLTQPWPLLPWRRLCTLPSQTTVHHRARGPISFAQTQAAGCRGQAQYCYCSSRCMLDHGRQLGQWTSPVPAFLAGFISQASPAETRR